MTDSPAEAAPAERRRHFRVEVEIQLAIGPFDHTVGDLQLMRLQERQTGLIRSLRVVQQRGDVAQAEAIDQVVGYLGVLMSLMRETRSTWDVETHTVSLSEGGIGFHGEPPCAVGEAVPVLILCERDPAWSPIEVEARLVRVQEGLGAEAPYLGFEFHDLGERERRQLVDIVYCAHRITIREGQAG